MRAWYGIGLTALMGLGVLAGWTSSASWAQDKTRTTSRVKPSTKKKATPTPALDAKANQLQTDFVKTAEQLASDYYDAGNYDKAKTLLKSILTLNPEQANVEAKLKLLEEELINSNGTDIEIDPGDGWKSAGVVVMTGKPIRLHSEGNFKLVLNGQLTTQGLQINENDPNAFVPELPLGALIGMVVPPQERTGPAAGGQRNNNRNDKPKPFLVGENCDHTPQKDGVLYLRINSPENKNTGKIKVYLSGQVQKIGG